MNNPPYTRFDYSSHERHDEYTHHDATSEHPEPAFWCSFRVGPGKCTVPVRGTPKMNSSSARIGYARVSTADQNLDAQLAALQAARCTMVRTETGDGATLRRASSRLHRSQVELSDCRLPPCWSKKDISRYRGTAI